MGAAAYTRIVIQTPQGGDLCPAVTLPEKAAAHIGAEFARVVEDADPYDVPSKTGRRAGTCAPP